MMETNASTASKSGNSIQHQRTPPAIRPSRIACRVPRARQSATVGWPAACEPALLGLGENERAREPGLHGVEVAELAPADLVHPDPFPGGTHEHHLEMGLDVRGRRAQARLPPPH